MVSDDLSELTVQQLVQQLFRIVEELERRYPERRFTPDGHLIGSLGEALAEEEYGLELLKGSTAVHDARSPNNTLVQIKLTQRRSIGLRSEPEALLVLSLKEDGSIEEVYNGPGAEPWRRAGKMQKNGQRHLGLGTLEDLMEAVSAHERLQKIVEPEPPKDR